jgi:hypothetical protein
MQAVKNEFTQQVFLGEETTFTLPSGNEIKARETNGDDDETLSNASAAGEGANIINFLASVVTHDKSLGRKPTVEDIVDWPLGDKYYAIYKIRIHNHGSELVFKEKSSKGVEVDFTQDLKEFDFFTPDPTNPSKKPSGQEAKPYPKGMQREVEFSTSRGNLFKFKILNSVLESKQLASTADITKNTPLTLRELKRLNNGQWELVTYFGIFPSKEMSEIRSAVEKLDPVFDPTVFITFPDGEQRAISLLAIPTFYFPEAQI